LTQETAFSYLIMLHWFSEATACMLLDFVVHCFFKSNSATVCSPRLVVACWRWHLI